MRWLQDITDSMDMSLSNRAMGVQLLYPLVSVLAVTSPMRA